MFGKMVHAGTLVAITEELRDDFESQDAMEMDSLEIEATQLPACSSKLDMSKAGLSRLPENITAFANVEEFFLGHNRLTGIDGNLELLCRLSRLRELHLESNHLRTIPRELLVLKNLTFLNLSDNEIQEIPPGITGLVNLDELILNRNEIKELPDGIRELRKLQHISLTENLIEIVPSFLLEMRALALTDVVTGREELGHDNEKNNLQNSLCKVNLRNNQLKGNIILGNYGNLTHLDLSENSIEKLDLSALQDLRSVRCARNVLTELTLCGRSLVSLIAGNNKLKKVAVNPEPIRLEHLDISFNELEALPEWIPDLPDLRALFASNNALTGLPDRLLSQPSKLEVLHLPHNRLQALPPPRKSLSIVHLTLQDNALTALPRNFFVYTDKLKILNLSNNRLSELPYTDENACPNRTKSRPSMEKLYLTGNCLTNTALDSLMKFTSMKVLHMAYNTLDTLPESCIAAWKKLEEMILSGNRLQYLPDNVANLPHLRVLRVHSNRLLTCPPFNRTTSLKVLDLAHNQLDRVNLESLVPSQLQFLDISCNTRLHVDPRQFQRYRSQRPVSLIDVSGQNRPTLPAHPRQADTVGRENSDHLPWRLGFSETPGMKEKLCVSQVRMPTFCNNEGLFGIFDGSLNQEAPGHLQEIIPRLLLEEKTIKETSAEYLKYTLLSAQKELKEKGQKYGVDSTLVHITKLPKSSRDVNKERGAERRRKYLLTVATCGDSKAVLCRATGPLQIAGGRSPESFQMIRLKNKAHQCNIATSLPYTAPDTTVEEVILEEDDEFIIVANRRVWEVLSIQEAVREARAEASPVLAAKRLQDLAQAYEAEDNLSILVVRLSSPGPGHVDHVGRMMHELRQAVQLKSTRNQMTSETCTCSCCLPRLAPHEPPAACCCNGQNANDNNSGNDLYLNGVLRNIISGRSSTSKSSRSTHQVRYYNKPNRLPDSTEKEVSVMVHRDDRSSPSGQSDQTSEGIFDSKSRRRTSGRGRFCSGSTTGSSRSATACKARTMNRGTLGSTSGHSTQDASSYSERSTAPSDEQLRCWEYMLEQNTQLLFDKELDTLTNTSRSISSPLRRGQSRSTPQLGSTNAVPFLSKRFGSARSFDPSGTVRTPMGIPIHTVQAVHPVPMSMIRSAFGSGRRPLNGGPNAAYFGSLQRLMPYNLEYDFAVIQERGALDSFEQDATRMQQYWGVATTEL